MTHSTVRTCVLAWCHALFEKLACMTLMNSDEQRAVVVVRPLVLLALVPIYTRLPRHNATQRNDLGPEGRCGRVLYW